MLGRMVEIKDMLGDIQRLPAALELMQGDNHARLAHGL